MPPRRDSSSSFVPPTLSPTHSCSTSQMSQSPQLENSPCPPSPLPLASDQFFDDISDIGDSDLDDDLSPVLDAMVTIPIPQNPTDVQILRLQTNAKRKSAIQKCELAIQECKLADADVREALLKAKMSRIRVQQAKHVLDATNIYCQNVNWTIQRSNYKDVSSKVTTVTESGEHGTKVHYIVNVPGAGSMAITLD